MTRLHALGGMWCLPGSARRPCWPVERRQRRPPSPRPPEPDPARFSRRTTTPAGAGSATADIVVHGVTRSLLRSIWRPSATPTPSSIAISSEELGKFPQPQRRRGAGQHPRRHRPCALRPRRRPLGNHSRPGREFRDHDAQRAHPADRRAGSFLRLRRAAVGDHLRRRSAEGSARVRASRAASACHQPAHRPPARPHGAACIRRRRRASIMISPTRADTR